MTAGTGQREAEADVLSRFIRTIASRKIERDEMSRLAVNGVEINFEIDDFAEPWLDRNSVKTVVMHHGALRNLKSFNSWVPVLGRRYRVLRFDARGWGGSSAPPESSPVTLEQMVRDTVDLTTQLGIDKFHFVGASFGGLVGQLIAVSHPDRLLSITLCDTPYKLPDTVRSTVVGDYQRLDIRVARAKSIHETFGLGRAEPKMLEWLLEESLKVPAHVALSIQKSIMAGDLSGGLGKIKVPTLLLGGDRSRIVPMETLALMKQQILNSRAAVFSGMATGMEMVIGDRCAATTLDFITEVDRGEAASAI